MLTREGFKAEERWDLIAPPCSTESLTARLTTLGIKQIRTVDLNQLQQSSGSWEHVYFRRVNWILLNSLPKSFRCLCRQHGTAGCRGETSGKTIERRWFLCWANNCTRRPGAGASCLLQGRLTSPVLVDGAEMAFHSYLVNEWSDEWLHNPASFTIWRRLGEWEGLGLLFMSVTMVDFKRADVLT